MYAVTKDKFLTKNYLLFLCSMHVLLVNDNLHVKFFQKYIIQTKKLCQNRWLTLNRLKTLSNIVCFSSGELQSMRFAPLEISFNRESKELSSFPLLKLQSGKCLNSLLFQRALIWITNCLVLLKWLTLPSVPLIR